MKRRGTLKILAIGIIVIFIGSSTVSSIHIGQKDSSRRLVDSFVGSLRERKIGMLDNMIDYVPYDESFISDYANRRYFERIIEDEEYEGLRKRYDDFSGRNEEEFMDCYTEQVMERFPYPHDVLFEDSDRYDGRYDQRMMSKYDEEPQTVSKQLTQKPDFENGTTWYVDAGGNGDFTRIQDAIDNASDGDTVFVFNGFYQENIVVSKSVIIQGEDREKTIIDGNHLDVIYVSNSWVTIKCFTIQNGWTGISLSFISDTTISENTITNNKRYGIYLWDSADHTLSGNTIKDNNGGGIYL
ncbi:MAG: NosD domain-containing protein, partial [Candidatus Thermoplasmatota archaeon]|nr:NosD domain-containing protein [Candidatus Thermoplasmatota archaeon]